MNAPSRATDNRVSVDADVAYVADLLALIGKSMERIATELAAAVKRLPKGSAR
jgi:hypothetical protein